MVRFACVSSGLYGMTMSEKKISFTVEVEWGISGILRCCYIYTPPPSPPRGGQGSPGVSIFSSGAKRAKASESEKRFLARAVFCFFVFGENFFIFAAREKINFSRMQEKK